MQRWHGASVCCGQAHVPQVCSCVEGAAEPQLCPLKPALAALQMTKCSVVAGPATGGSTGLGRGCTGVCSSPLPAGFCSSDASSERPLLAGFLK